MTHYCVSVDVGTRSVRAGIISSSGIICSFCEREIQVWNPEIDHYEQSSVDIWESVIYCIQNSIQNSNIDINAINSIAFDATCSLLVFLKFNENSEIY